MGNFKKIFSDEQEKEIVEYVQLMESRLFGLTVRDLRKLAYQLAVKNDIKHNFNAEEEMAGVDWAKGFLNRHSELLSLRRPEPTSAARAMGFNRVVVSQFFGLLCDQMDKHKFGPTRIFNVDETGITSVPKSHSKIISLRGRRQVGCLTSAERGHTVTAVLCFSAAGQYVPPFLIFPRQRMKDGLLDDAPPGTAATCHPSGWMQADIFVEWLKHFIHCVKPSKDDPVLLLLDGHASHTKNIEAIDVARNKGIVMLCFPPHCTHKLQPLDVGFMGPLSKYYSREVKSWLRNNPGRVVTQLQISKILGAAYAEAATVKTATSSFMKTGIFPTNPNIFNDVDFMPSETTDRQMLNDEAKQVSALQASMKISNESSSSTPQMDQRREELPSPQKNESLLTFPSCSTSTPKKSGACSESLVVQAFQISPKDVQPIPYVTGSSRRSDKRRGKTAVLTESPYKNSLQSGQKQSKRAKCNRSLKNTLESCNKHKAKRAKYDQAQADDEGSSDDTRCQYCKEKYSETKRNDDWICCVKCKKWAHEICTGWPQKAMKYFECNFC